MADDEDDDTLKPYVVHLSAKDVAMVECLADAYDASATEVIRHGIAAQYLELEETEDLHMVDTTEGEGQGSYQGKFS